MAGELHTSQIIFEGIDGIRRLIPGTELEVVQLGLGPPRGRTIHALTDGFAISGGWRSGDVRSSGSFDFHRVTIGARIGGSGEMTRLGWMALPGAVYVYPPGAEHYGRTTGDISWLKLTVEPSLLADLVGLDGAVGDRGIWESRRRYPASPSIRASISCSLDTVLQRLASGDAPWRGRRLEMLEHRVLESFLAGVVEDEEHPGGGPSPAEELVRRVELWIDDHEVEPVHVADICRSFGVHRRTLQRAFQKALGMGPAQFLARRRLALVRMTLLDADPRLTNVTDVAMDQGFFELGRFAVRYRQLFGERPSDTLHRTDPRPVARSAYHSGCTRARVQSPAGRHGPPPVG